MIIVVFVPRLYADQKHIELVVGKCVLSSQVTTSMNTWVRQIAPMLPKRNPTLGKMLDESTGVKIPPSLREEHPADTQ